MLSFLSLAMVREFLRSLLAAGVGVTGAFRHGGRTGTLRDGDTCLMVVVVGACLMVVVRLCRDR